MGVPSQAREAAAAIEEVLGRRLVGIYLYGSAADGGLRPDSDLDLLVLAGTTLDDATRDPVIETVLALSGGPGRRPLEVTIVAVDSVVPWRYPPAMEMQYGEWLRMEALAGNPLGPRPNPDLAVLLTQARERSVPLIGPPADTVLEPVPARDLRRAIIQSLPSLLDDLEGDERNVILTLARMWVTLETGEIVPKDVAADRMLSVDGIRPASRHVLLLARDAYRGDTVDDWNRLQGEIGEFVDEATAAVTGRSSGLD